MCPRDAGRSVARGAGKGNRSCRRIGHVRATGAVNPHGHWGSGRCFPHSGPGLSLGMRPGDVRAAQRSRRSIRRPTGFAASSPGSGGPVSCSPASSCSFPSLMRRVGVNTPWAVRCNPCPTVVPLLGLQGGSAALRSFKSSAHRVEARHPAPNDPRPGPARRAGSERWRPSRITAGAGRRRLRAPSELRFAGRCDPAPPGSPQGDRRSRHAIPIRDSNPESRIGAPGIPS